MSYIDNWHQPGGEKDLSQLAYLACALMEGPACYRMLQKMLYDILDDQLVARVTTRTDQEFMRECLTKIEDAVEHCNHPDGTLDFSAIHTRWKQDSTPMGQALARAMSTELDRRRT